MKVSRNGLERSRFAADDAATGGRIPARLADSFAIIRDATRVVM